MNPETLQNKLEKKELPNREQLLNFFEEVLKGRVGIESVKVTREVEDDQGIVFLEARQRLATAELATVAYTREPRLKKAEIKPGSTAEKDLRESYPRIDIDIADENGVVYTGENVCKGAKYFREEF